MSHPLALILLDAFRWDYLDPKRTPFLWGLAQQGCHVRRIVPGAGFCERAEILTGATGRRTGYFTAIGRDPAQSPFRLHRRWIAPLGRVTGRAQSSTYRKVVARVARRLGIKMPLYRIPLPLLSELVLTEDRFDHRLEGGLSVESLLDVLREEDLPVHWQFTALGVPNGQDRERMERFVADAGQERGLHLVYVGQPDVDGHRFGPESAEMEGSLRRLDGFLEKSLNLVRSVRPNLNVVVMGDHGMTTVRHRLDVGTLIEEKARELGLVWKRDYVYFLDSTVARLWTSESVRGTLRRALADTELGHHGEWIESTRAHELDIPFPDDRYGDLLWWAHPGILIHPDFFHGEGERVYGMHGYDPAHEDSQGCAIMVGPSIEAGTVVDGGRLIDLCPTMADLLGVRTPGACEGKSLLARVPCS